MIMKLEVYWEYVDLVEIGIVDWLRDCLYWLLNSECEIGIGKVVN